MTIRARDAFKSARAQSNGITLDLHGETIPMLLSYKTVRAAAKDWQTYSSDAPFRVPIPSEENERSVRQLPIETDPPAHKKYRSLIEPFFRRPMQADYVAKVDALIFQSLEACASRGVFDIVRDFALPVQSRALTYLLGVPESEADIWIDWGIHVFRDGADPGKKGSALEAYLRHAIQAAQSGASDENFFEALNRMKVDDRLLDEKEKLGIANLVFAGGRDTVINAIATVMSCFARAPQDLAVAVSDAKAVNLAVEEFVRVISPLTHIGRVCRGNGPSGSRVSLCWAAANYDPSVFDDPETVDLARSPNPHVGFGSGHHTCLGAPQARAILRALIRNLVAHVASVRIEEEISNVEHYGQIERPVGYERLMASLTLRSSVQE